MAIAISLCIIFISLFVTYAYQRLKHRDCVSKKRLDGKTVLVTGGSAGMGLEIAKEMARRGAKVIIACASETEGQAGVRQVEGAEFLRLDLGSLRGTRRAAAALRVRGAALHLLVNNAGVGGPDARTRDRLHHVMQVNYFGAVLLTLLLLPLLKSSGTPAEPARIINVASIMHLIGRVNIDDLNESSYFVYPNSKLCLVMFTKELAKRLKGDNVVVNSLEPGFVGTRFFDSWNKSIGFAVTWFSGFFCKTPWMGAQTTLHVALDESAGRVSGEHFVECQVSKSWRIGDEVTSTRLWEESLRIVGMEPDDCI